MNTVIDGLKYISDTSATIIGYMDRGIDTKELAQTLNYYSEGLSRIPTIVPQIIYKDYEEFFNTFALFCKNATENMMETEFENIYSSINLVVECLAEIITKMKTKLRVCPCCGGEVAYLPLSSYYADMKAANGSQRSGGVSETLNHDEYLCPNCGSSDRDRMIVSFMKKNNIEQGSENRAVLQVAPAKPIENWITRACPQVRYETTDLYMDGVDYKSDIQDLKELEDERYDLIICSHVLEHVKDDRKAMAAMRRVLKPEGMIAFLVPIDLTVDEIDEEWGLSEAENWRRFGQGDHCRSYSKKGLVERLSEFFFVSELGRDYFGAETFKQCGLTDTSTLYILTKKEGVSFNLKDESIIENVPLTGPVVSVVMSAYNHGKFVADAVESVLNQTYKNIEFLVADDGSPDDTAQVMKRYSGRYAHEAYFTDNAGSRTAYLLTKSTGKYIALMHSDDVWEPDKIALQVHYLETHEECGACFTWCQYTDADLQPIDDNVFIQRNRTRAEWIRFLFERDNVFSNPSSLIRRELYVGVNYLGCDSRQLSDLYKWVNVIQRYDVHIVQKILIRMRRHMNKTTGETNVSANTAMNGLRFYVEQGAHWIAIIRNMDDDLFKKAFIGCFVDKSADGEQIKCEKFFILKNSRNPYVRYSAFAYMAEIYPTTKDYFNSLYHYTLNELWKDECKYYLSTLESSGE